VVVVLFVVEDFVDGERVGEVVKIDSDSNDLFTTWLLRLFYAMFSAVSARGAVTFSALDNTGVSRTFNLKRDLGSLQYHIFNTYTCANGVRVRYGTGSTSPTRTDTRLVSEIYVDYNPKLYIDENGSFIIIESFVVFGSSVNVCEVGLSLFGNVVSVTGCGEFLLDRTVFSPCRSVPAGTPYMVRYRVQL
jgi:hypothetical protein